MHNITASDIAGGVRNLARRLLAAAFIAGMAAPVYGAVPYPPPTTWKGINYSPRRHSYFRMLYDWGAWDSAAGKYVHQMVDDDLTRLSQNGFNLVHLYLWDQDIFPLVGQPNEPSGFVSAPGNPANSPNNQWENLNDFVTKAEEKGLFVALHFVSGRLLHRVGDGDDPETVATEFANWAGAFIQHLNSTHERWNVLLWGLQYSFYVDWSDLGSTRNVTWRKAYKKVDDVAMQYSPAPYVLGLIGVNLSFDHLKPTGELWDWKIYPRGSGYTWAWQDQQKTAQAMRTLLTQEYGGAKDPDIYMLQLWHPNSYDLKTALQQLTTGYVPGGLPVPYYKLFVVEFATSSSLNNTPNGGNNIPYFGDSQTPTTTVAGLSQWLTNTLCVMRDTGIDKMAYWSMYDPYTMWTGAPWYDTGQQLAWSGFWGLSYETEGYGDKSTWTTLRSYYLNGTLACASPFATNATPVVSLTPSSSYYTVNQPVRLTWTAADVASSTLDRGHGATYSCRQDQTGELSPTDIVGSCARTDAAAYSTTGAKNVTLTGINNYGTSQNATASFNIGAVPIVSAVTDQDYSYTINRYDTIVVWGNGFSLTGGNTIQLIRDGYQTIEMNEGDGHYFWNESHTQMNASLDGRAAAGLWTLKVLNPYSPTPSSGYALTIYP